MMEWGEHESFLKGQARRTGITPQALKNKPILEQGLSTVIECYTLCRNENGVAPLSEIELFFRTRGGYDLDRFFVLVKGVEVEVLAAQERRRKQREKPGNG